MKILSLHIHGFGRWKNMEVSFSPGFNLVYGPNEAGKSTLLHFIQAMFYGLGDKRGNILSEKPRERFQPWQGGAYGGTITFHLDGVDYKLERSFGKTKSFDKITLWDEANASERALKPELEPGEQLFKMSLSEFRNSVFTGQTTTQVANENEMKRRLSATMTGSEAAISTDDMVQKLEKIKLDIGGEKRSASLITKLRADEQRLTEEQNAALENHQAIEAASHSISAQEELLTKTQKEQAQFRLLKEQANTSIENKRLMEGLADSEKLAVLHDRLESAREAFQADGKILTEADLDTLSLKLADWSNLESSLRTTEDLKAQQRQQLLTLEDGGRTAKRAQSLKQLQEKELTFNKDNQVFQEALRHAEQAFLEEKHEEEQKIGRGDLELLKLRSQHKDQLKNIEAVLEHKNRLKVTQDNIEKAINRQASLNNRLKLAHEASAQILDEKNLLQSEITMLKESNQKLSRWESDWDKNEKQDRLSKIGIAIGIIGLLLAALSLVFGAETWPWFVLVGAVLVLIFCIWHKTRLYAERKNLAHDRNTVRSNNEKLLNLNANAEQQEKQLQWSKAQEQQLMLDSQEIGTEKQGLEAELTALKSRVLTESEQALDSESLSTLQAQFAEEEEASERTLEKQRKSALERVFTMPDALGIQKAKLDTTAYSLKQALALEDLENAEALHASLQQLNEKQSQMQHLRASIEEFDRLIGDYRDQRQAIQVEVEQRSFARIRHDDLRLAKSDLDELLAQMENLRLLEQDNERTAEALKQKLGTLSEAEAVLKLEANRQWLRQHGLEEKIESREQLQHYESQLSLLEGEISKQQENLWRNQEKMKGLLSKTRMPAQIERELGMNQAAIEEVLAEVASIALAQKWIKEAEQEQRRSFGPAINSKFSEMLSRLSGEEAPKLYLSNDFEIRLEDAETGVTRERDYFSAGKIDQLQLALRLAIIETVYMQEIPLPLIFDDSFVQFDRERMQHALKFLISLVEQEGLQIIFSTCHLTIMEYIKNEANTQLIAL